MLSNPRRFLLQCLGLLINQFLHLADLRLGLLIDARGLRLQPELRLFGFLPRLARVLLRFGREALQLCIPNKQEDDDDGDKADKTMTPMMISMAIASVHAPTLFSIDRSSF